MKSRCFAVESQKNGLRQKKEESDNKKEQIGLKEKGGEEERRRGEEEGAEAFWCPTNPDELGFFLSFSFF